MDIRPEPENKRIPNDSSSANMLTRSKDELQKVFRRSVDKQTDELQLNEEKRISISNL